MSDVIIDFIYIQILFGQVLCRGHVLLCEELVARPALWLISWPHRPHALPHVRLLVHMVVDCWWAHAKQDGQGVDADAHTQQMPCNPGRPIVWLRAGSVVRGRDEMGLALCGQ